MSNFSLNDDFVASLNERLTALKLSTTATDLTVADITDSTENSKVLSWLNALLEELLKLQDNKNFKPCNTATEVMEALKDDPPFFTLSSPNWKLKLITFLCSQIQAYRLIQHNEKNKKIERVESISDTLSTEDSSAILFQLEKICKLLGIRPGFSERSISALTNAINTKIAKIKEETPELLSSKLPKIITPTPNLTENQLQKLKIVEEMLYKDFELRREMLMRRMEVTTESFLWSDKAAQSKEEIRSTVQTNQMHLTAPPMRYQLHHALEANVSLLEEQSKRVTADPSQYGSASSGDGEHSTGGVAVKSITKQVLVGDVPDRGGRASEVRSKQLQQDIRRTFGGHGGGGKSTACTHSSTYNSSNSGDREKKDNGSHGGGSGKKGEGVVQEGVGEQGQEVLNSGSNSSTARRKGKGSNREKSSPQEAQDMPSTATSAGNKKAVEKRPSAPATTTATTATGTTTSAAGATKVTTIIGTNQSNSSNTGRTVSITVQDLVPGNQGTTLQQQQGPEKLRKPRHRNRHKASSSQENST